MNINFNGSEVLADITNEILRMKNITEKQEKTAMKKIGNVIKKNVIEVLPKSETKSGYSHMKNDVKVKVKSKNGFSSVAVMGGRDTAYKWHMLADGTLNPDGTTHTRATHFDEIAIRNSKSEIDSIMSELEREVANGE